MKKDRDYIFLESTLSLCSTCMERVQAKIIRRNDKIFILKNCPKHGIHEELMEEVADFYVNRHAYDKPSTASLIQTKSRKGCPYDCGLCPDHEQHTCIGLIEITQKCDLGCPMCYAYSGEGKHLSLAQISKMMDFHQKTENNEAEILQISGGEPTTHPQIVEILKMARAKKYKFVMLNTNGLRLAEDEELCKTISEIFPNSFELYFQFDGFEENTYQKLRGRKELLKIKLKALENLTKYNVPVTLVSTVQNGINDHEIGKIIEFGIKTKIVRGINFQHMAYFGRLPKIDIKNRLTLTGILNRIEKQTNGLLKINDFIPLPCDVDRVAVTFMYRANGQFIPLTRNVEIKSYLPFIQNTLQFSASEMLSDTIKKMLKGQEVCQCFDFLKDFSKLVPAKLVIKTPKKRAEFVYENTFRITSTSFVDRYNFDSKSMKKECVHVITKDLKKIPFSAYNMIYREQK